MKTLKIYAKEHGIKYRAAWNRFKAGLINDAFIDEYGKILIPEKASFKQECTIIYTRVSSAQNKDNLDSQAFRLTTFCNAKGWKVFNVIKEVGSGLNDTRPKLLKLLKDKAVTRIVVEHKDRLTRFGFEFISLLAEERNIEIVIVNNVDDNRQDLMQDFVSIVTSFCARIYGLRRTKRKTEQLIKELTDAP